MSQFNQLFVVNVIIYLMSFKDNILGGIALEISVLNLAKVNELLSGVVEIKAGSFC